MEKSIIELHAEHKEWVNRLLFYKDDLHVMQHRLDEIVKKNTSNDVMVNLEHFQNQLKIQQEQIDILKHEIKKQQNVIEKSISDNPVASDHRTMEDDVENRDKIQRFEELFADLRKELLTFWSKWM